MTFTKCKVANFKKWHSGTWMAQWIAETRLKNCKLGIQSIEETIKMNFD